MTDGTRAILLALTDNQATIDGLFAWVRAQDWTATVELRWPDDESYTYQASVSRRAGSQRRTIGNGFGRTGYDALGLAIVCAAAPDKLCDECYGQGRFRQSVCPACHGSGLAPSGE